MSNINKNTTAENMTIGGNIYQAGNATNFKTGDWRSIKPIYISDKCKQCGLCFPVCPEDAIPVNKDGNREDFNFDYCKGFLLHLLQKFRNIFQHLLVMVLLIRNLLLLKVNIVL